MSQQALPGMAALLAAMEESPSVPDGWDVVLNLSQPAVQSLVRSNWHGKSPTDYSLVWVAPVPVNGQYDVVEVETDLPPPAVSLSVTEQAVHVGFGIGSGTLRSGKAPAELVSSSRDARSVVESGEVSWAAPVEITRQNPLQLAGLLPVGVEAATGGRNFSIGLSLADGNLTLSGSNTAGISSLAMDQNLGKWLAAETLGGQIGTLTLQDGAGATVLTPAKVTARVAASRDGQPVLQIMTATSTGATAPVGSDPVPHPDSYDFSLIVCSKATMTMIANGYNLGTGIIKLASVPPQDGRLHWFAQVHEPMVFEGTFGNQDGKIYVTDHSKLYMRFGGSTDQGLKLFTYIDPSSTIQLQLDLAAHYPTRISGTGADQVVGLQEGAQSVTANGFYEAIVQPRLETFLNGDIKSDMSKVRMTALSDLVLRDLALSGHRLQFEVAALPAELLIAGSLKPDA
ncbi:hypothetical protein [Bradyrhizobium sp. Ash2021]|uniref:hypothetical protein n=1 Tax=Bradyrhizobium sp. Ash2021 TaxID=2954771 RepID=UPI002816150F|nr:hypothetical protein [Bradyrhizobium sp. Ash2021]WMT76956.1 hypothetical protein NL528_11640 [Bradyrhizobium sp. Ash2021]